VDRNDHDEGLNRDHDDECVGNNYDVSGVDEDDINPHTRLTEKDFVMAMVNNKNELFSYLILRFYVTGQALNIGRSTEIGETRDRKKKEPDSINFIESEDIDERIIFASGRIPHGHLLPDDMHFSSKQFLQLFLKPQFMLNSKRQYEAQPEPESDDAALPDMTIYTAGDSFYDDYGEEDELEGEFGDNLVTQTKRNRPEFIKYAKTAKRIDVKKLKENMWKTLADNTTFSGVICDLKKICPQRKMKDISVPLCFVSLLHLANEKGLEITNNDQLTELHIVKLFTCLKFGISLVV
ncbi:5301_t:CDS:2, partial [Funneliformis mosseae]